MAMLTVDDLARDLKVRNEDLVRELVGLGFEVEGPESRVETDDPVGLRAELITALPQQEVIEKRIKPTVIRRRIKKKPKGTDRKAASAPEPTIEEPEEAVAPEPEAEAPPIRTSAPAEAEPEIAEPTPKEPPKKVAKKKKVQPAKIIEEAPKPRPIAEAAPTTAETALRAPEAEAPHPPPPHAKAAPETASEPKREDVVVPAPPKIQTPSPSPEAAPEPVSAPPREEEEPEVEAEAPEAEQVAEPTEEPEDEKKAAEDKTGKRKKKREKKMQPAQIIGRVELKKEPKVKEEPAPPPQPARPRRPPVEAVQPVPAPVPPESAEEERRRKRKKGKKVREAAEEKAPESPKTSVRRRKEVLLKQDLYDDRPRGGRARAKGKKPKHRKPEITTPKAGKRKVKLPEAITVADLAHKMSVKASDVIQQLLALGVTATVNEGIDYETASVVAGEFGFEVESTERTEEHWLPVAGDEDEANLESRPPVITIMGHVDHGKTSLLDYIRASHVTDQEAGGITQHIGAYKVKRNRGELVFLDTPGHEAFTAMRARGAQVTDFVVLIVAADDGVKEQSREAINHARAAKVPIVVAVNKIDKPEADRDRVVRELSELELIPESWGGDTLFSFVSAKTGEGVNEFLDLILLQAEMMELKANPRKQALGNIVEARLDKGKGPVATILVAEGTLKLGDPFVAGVHYGKVRAMLDQDGNLVEEAGPATPVEVQGFSGVPEAGEQFIVVKEEKSARQIGAHRQEKLRKLEALSPEPMSLDELMARMSAEEVKELNLVLKADVQGSVEALKEALLGLSTDDVKVRIIHDGVGTVTESDVMLAGASNAIIIGFNVRPTPKTSQMAEDKNIEIRLYNVIYEAIEDVRNAMEGLLAPLEKEVVTGRAEVRETFSVPKIGKIAGCFVTSGKIHRSNQIRLLRDDVEVYSGRIASMKRFKDDIREAVEGYECGIGLENYRGVKVGDIIEAYVIEEEAQTL